MDNEVDKNENVVVIVVDSLRYDVASNQELMPFLNQFATKHSGVIEAYTNAPSTHFALPCLLTGYMPLEINNKASISEAQHKRFLPVLFKKKGYHTVGVTGNVVTSSYFGYSFGFDDYEDFIERKEGEYRYQWHLKVAQYIPKILKNTLLYPIKKYILGNLSEQNIDAHGKIRGEEINAALKSCDLAPNNNFIFLHYMEPHTPYVPKGYEKDFEKVRELTKLLYTEPETLSNKDIDFLREKYDQECANFDQVLKDMIEYLQQKLDWENTKLMILGDHGEAFGETGYYVHPGDKTSNIKGHIRIPVVIKGREGIVSENDTLWTQDLYEWLSGIKLKNKSDLCMGYKAEDKHDLKDSRYTIVETNNLKKSEIIDTNKVY